MKRILCFFILVLSFLFLALIFLARSWRAEIYQPSAEKTDSIAIHFIHGSFPKPGCTFSRKRLGGLLGGHIEIELNDTVYGFLPEKLPIHIFPQEKYNATFQKQSLTKWEKYNVHEMITSVSVPVSSHQCQFLADTLKDLSREVPVDYAFFGYRCASLTALLLRDAKIFAHRSKWQLKLAFFHPQAMRIKWIEIANENEYPVRQQKGIECRVWEDSFD